MKKNYSFITVLLFSISVWSQAPQKMSYQAIIRNSNNTLITSTPIGMRISILQGSTSGTAVYIETQTPLTNANGLVSLEIGSGTPVTGTFSTIDWATGPYFIKTETDPTGGTTYTITGTNELMSVPYALFSANGTPGPQGPIGLTGATGPSGLLPAGSATGNTPYWNGLDWVVDNNNIFNAGGNVGIGTDNPSAKLEVIGSIKTDNFRMTTGAGTGKVLTSDANGNGSWQNPSNVAFSVFQTTGNSQQNPPINTIFTNDFDAVTFDYGNNFNLTNNTFIVPSSGLYYFSVTINAYVQATFYIRLKVNNGSYDYNPIGLRNGTTNYNYPEQRDFTFSGIIQLNANDTVSLESFAAPNTFLQTPVFMGYKVF